jgi:hypothetical protein
MGLKSIFVMQQYQDISRFICGMLMGTCWVREKHSKASKASRQKGEMILVDNHVF